MRIPSLSEGVLRTVSGNYVGDPSSGLGVQPQSCHSDNKAALKECLARGVLGGALCGAIYDAGESICRIL
jgi:hypothetical protein